MTDIQLLDAVAALAVKAGAEVMAVYATAFSVHGKPDESPVTAADQRAEAVILAGLRALTPALPIVAEEEVAAGRGPALDAGCPAFWLVDPLDGTREFVKRNGEFTVNVALVRHGAPVLGVVLAPALEAQSGVASFGGRLWAGAVGYGAWVRDGAGRRAISCRHAPPAGLTVLASRSHGDDAALQAWLADRRVAHLNTIGSSMKLCLLAQGLADLYPRLGRTMEWDIAAGHAVLAAAGGSVRRIEDGAPLVYGKPGFENPFFVASGLA